MKYDFCGWATKNDLKCADGRTIRHGAFSHCNGKKVPLVWNHKYDSPNKVLGHAILEERPEGMYAYCSFNNGSSAADAREALAHGDIESLSIYADNLRQMGKEVLHGTIKELSIVLAGANPGACIESVLAHGELIDEDEEEGILFTGEPLILEHSDLKIKDDEKDEKKESKDDKGGDSGETVKDVYNTLNEKQKTAVAIIVGQAIKDSKSGDSDSKDDDKKEEIKHSDEGGNEKMAKFNAFEQGKDGKVADNVLTHSDMQEILKIASSNKVSSLREVFNDYVTTNGKTEVLLHSAIDKTGMDTASGNQTYGINDVAMLLPEPKTMNIPPEFISREMGWVSEVINSVHKTPFSRVKSLYADITEDEARAKGYIKGKQKKEEVFTTLKRTTTPCTIYKKQKLDRDDIIDITDFDVVAWIKGEMQMMWDEEFARAILVGDGRQSDSDDKIKEDCIRPIVKDVPLFNTTIVVTVDEDATDAEIAEVLIDEIIKSKKKYKGSGNPTFFTTTDYVTDMLILKDKIGHRLYKTRDELATTLGVKKVTEVEVMEGQKLDYNEDHDLDLIGTMVNLVDYNVGNDKGGEKSFFDAFDIDFNQYKYLLESRRSGALIKPFSAVTFLLKRGQAAG